MQGKILELNRQMQKRKSPKSNLQICLGTEKN